jgi:SAM-dependent methyltransferase
LTLKRDALHLGSRIPPDLQSMTGSHSLVDPYFASIPKAALRKLERDYPNIEFSPKKAHEFLDYALANGISYATIRIDAPYTGIIDESSGFSSLCRKMFRVLRPGGEAFITVWNRWQPRFWFKPKNTRVPWRSGATTLYRYYYLFSYGELEKTARQAGFEILNSFPESRYRFPLKTFSRNICLLVRKG